MKSATDGLILVGPSLEVLYANPEAVDVFAYPQNSRGIPSFSAYLERKIQAVLLREPSSPEAGFVTTVKSGRRSYQCRAFSLRAGANGSRHSPAMAILIERGGKLSLDTSKLVEQFRLTQRESETVDHLIHGLTSKEIAVRMKISPNTVKAFLRLVMVKTGTSTRPGVLGKIIEAAQYSGGVPGPRTAP